MLLPRNHIDVYRGCYNTLKKASLQTWIPFQYILCVKQLVEDFAIKIAKVLTLIKSHQKPLDIEF